jgi:hypothetical protein
MPPLALVDLGQVGELDDGVVRQALVDDRPDRHSEFDVGAVAAGAVGAFAVTATLRFEDLLVAVVDEGVEVGVGANVDRAAASAVAAVGTAAGDELLAAETHGTAAAVAGCDVDVDFVYEHDCRCRSRACARPRGATVRRLRLQRVNADDAALGAVVLELHGAVDLGKQRVVLAEADVEAGPEAAAALPYQDRPAGDDVAVEALDAEAL